MGGRLTREILMNCTSDLGPASRRALRSVIRRLMADGERGGVDD